VLRAQSALLARLDLLVQQALQAHKEKEVLPALQEQPVLKVYRDQQVLLEQLARLLLVQG
jgi:hypothetical protein